MTTSLDSPKRPLPLALALGVLGGAALIVTTMLSPGQMVLLPYAALVLASLAAVRLAGWPDFPRRFAAAFLAFMVATAALYVFVATSEDVTPLPLSGHVWRLGLMAAIGGVLSGAVAYLADLGQRAG